MPSVKKTATVRRRPKAELIVDSPPALREIVDAYEAAKVPRTRVIAALVNEIARSRVRHRALLDLLEQSGTIELQQYIQRYKELEEVDFLPFVDLLLLSAPEFKEKNSAWLEKSTERFGYDGSSRPHVHLTGPPAEAPPMKRINPEPAKPRRRKAK